MKNLLVVKSSLFGEGGQSTLLVDHFVSQYSKKYAGTQVVTRDLSKDTIPHLDQTRVAALFSQPTDRTTEQQIILDQADLLLKELSDADVVVLAVPMYNFSIPSQLKSWFDHLARAGVSFKYTETGPVGLLNDKPVYIMAARGGVYNANGVDFQTPFVTQFLNLLGLKQLNFVYAEGLNLGEEPKAEAIKQAMNRIDFLITV
ncbi:FMN-dependent NADH-azoreductase [Shewanella ulleungensis]|uniref:FMN dependent NADH:quinone oxidoreductase n=1 Tax=Shewanella ulleungensis TaxID=2282699 RepID=A0ABQ2QDN4_9GAMM|nr:NAD(P)H-dependent oxidoreductase [Shewanella ulleungensis]MCL1148873.1 NAD(P)H-dependent oxidoreductase [Shewanella ulleungensis]GGP75081.1 FMN-dependent NADH-azoreductase [Shewanella ulleungensis]